MNCVIISGTTYQSEVGEVFGEIGGEPLAKFGRRIFELLFAGGNRQKHFPPKLHRKFHHQTFHEVLGYGGPKQR